ncbi:PhzF family phenazine biosynthesis protein [Pasteurellaceae bacterium USgator11]|nr:PhzF family phenazine biosynthesis protein [Pasteurellaceae bacterium UScroc12]TNG95554.1 PhzF family phenazine biosynthesis protein [Pasteurellaceae bacterium UScroc31]TNG97995.1 PhzF family phenazine biosynthesis protein [Pasteurellaceae bacterium USgator11]
MKSHAYQLVNVFAEQHFGGNPLAVFPQADGLNEQQMQRIARQFNLSETVFVQRSDRQSAVRKLKIFTPEYEMPFAGHPTVGAAFVLHRQLGLSDNYQLQTEAGLVSLHHQTDTITFALNNAARLRNSGLSKVDSAQILGLQQHDIAAEPVWVNTGTEQLLLQLTSAQAVANCRINTAPFLQKAVAANGEAQLYVWFEQHNQVKVRLFFSANGEVREDPGTGSAAANLGGWALHSQRTPLNWQITQGDEIGRPNRLSLTVDEQQTIYVGGKVIKVGQGEFWIPED